jgi:predicted transcriptional regulator of viral defense system
MAFVTLENWVDDRQTGGRYSFLRSEALAESGLSAEALKKALQRLAARGRIAKAKDYFFVIVPLEYAAAGGPPAAWFVDDLMGAMKLPYYVGLLTAAALHGASGQQPQEFQIVTDRPVRTITVGRSRIRFFASKFAHRAAAASVKTPTGSMRVATPETTVIDLVRFARWIGQLEGAASVIADLAPQLDPRKLVAAAKVVGDVPSAQRLGYILDRVHARDRAEPLRRWVERQSPALAPLRSHCRGHESKTDRRWHVLVDQPLEVEA